MSQGIADVQGSDQIGLEGEGKTRHIALGYDIHAKRRREKPEYEAIVEA